MFKYLSFKIASRSLNYLFYKHTSFVLENKELTIRIHDCGTNIRKLYTSPDWAGG